MINPKYLTHLFQLIMTEILKNQDQKKSKLKMTSLES